MGPGLEGASYLLIPQLYSNMIFLTTYRIQWLHEPENTHLKGNIQSPKVWFMERLMIGETMPEARCTVPGSSLCWGGGGCGQSQFTGPLSTKIILSRLGSTTGTLEGLLKDQMEEKDPIFSGLSC